MQVGLQVQVYNVAKKKEKKVYWACWLFALCSWNLALWFAWIFLDSSFSQYSYQSNLLGREKKAEKNNLQNQENLAGQRIKFLF